MPKLKIDIAPSLQRLNLVVKGVVNTNFIGNYASVFKGQGLEFANFRQYTPSDDASRIDWKTSSRVRKLMVKEFVEERNLNVVFILDVSSKMLVGSTAKLKCEYAAELVASFSHVVLKSGDRVGLLMVNDKISKELQPSNGMGHFQIISEALSNLSFYGGNSNLEEGLDYALKRIDRGSLVIIISDFIGDSDYHNSLKLAGKKFDLIGMSIQDPTDLELPEGMGQVLVQDPVTEERMLIDPKKIGNLYSSEAKHINSSVEKLFRQSGGDFLSLKTNKPFIESLVMFFKMREAKWK